MSKHLELPLVLLTPSAMALVWSLPASASPPVLDYLAVPVPEGCLDPAGENSDDAAPHAVQPTGTDESQTSDETVPTPAEQAQPAAGGRRPPRRPHADPTPTSKPEPEPVQPAAVQFQNCDDARAKGAAPVYAGHPGYGAHLDSDADGIGCEVETVASTQPTNYDTGTLAYTCVATEPLIAWGAALLAAGGWLILAGRRKA